MILTDNPSPEEIARGWRDAHVKPLWEIEQAHRPDGPPDPPAIWRWPRTAKLPVVESI